MGQTRGYVGAELRRRREENWWRVLVLYVINHVTVSSPAIIGIGVN